MKKTIQTILTTTLLLLGTQAYGEICAIDNVPAATLLLPYFTVPLPAQVAGPPTTVRTYFSVTNTSPSPVMAHVTLWTDWSRPELNFDIALDGYAVKTVDMHDLFLGADPELQAIFSGMPDSEGLCGGSYDGSYHGYVTIDANIGPTTLAPSDQAYWDGSVTHQDETGNVLAGDYVYVDVTNARAEAFPMVHIEAFAEITEAAGTTAESSRSFYSRYLGTSSDGREPLPTTYGARYMGTSPQDTFLQIWRTGPPGDPPPRDTCGSNPFTDCSSADTCPGLDLHFAMACDNDSFCIQNDVACIDLETQNLNVFDDLGSGFEHGWYYLNLQSSCTDGQAYMTVTQYLPELSGGWGGVALDGSCTQFAEAAPTTLPKQPMEQNPL